jgi:hypothetical protein
MRALVNLSSSFIIGKDCRHLSTHPAWHFILVPESLLLTALKIISSSEVAIAYSTLPRKLDISETVNVAGR